MKTYRGFSLIELMVVIAVSAILLMVGVPGMLDLMANNRLVSQANALVGDITYARSEAIKRNQSVNLCRTNDATSTTCASGSTWTHWMVTNAGGSVLRRGTAAGGPDHIVMSSTLPNNRLTFAPNGLANVAAGTDTVTLCHKNLSGDNRRVLTVGISGRVTVQSASGGC